MRRARARTAEHEPLDEVVEVHEQLSNRIEALLTTPDWTPTLTADLRRLHAEQRGLVGEHLAPSARAYVRVRGAVARLSQLGAVSEIIKQGAVEAAEAADLHRVLLSRVEEGALVAETLYLRADDEAQAATLEELRRSPLRLEYPLLECEVLRRRNVRLVLDVDDQQRHRYAFGETLGWNAYVVAPVLVRGRVVGFFHGDRAPDGRPLAPIDADALGQFACGFAQVFESAVLRRRLRDHRRELQRIATWAAVRTGELSNGAFELFVTPSADDDSDASSPRALAKGGPIDLLTARELDVLKLMAAGKTNVEIARTLVVTQGTAKFHVKNILRKMQASNRADASSRYLRLTLGEQADRAPSAP